MRYQAIDCANDSDCVAFGNMRLNWPWNRVTSDGGKTWQTTFTDSSEKIKYIRVFDVAYPDSNLCIAVGDSNYYWRSTDKCKTWTTGNLNTIYYDNHLTEFRIGMANKYFGAFHTPQELFLTNDGGLTWLRKELTLEDSLKPLGYQDVEVLKDSTIILLVYNKLFQFYIIRSNDAGNNWEAYNPISRKLRSIFYLNGKEGWATGGRQTTGGSPIYFNIIMHTTDGGRNWELQLDSLPEQKDGLLYIHFADSLNGTAVGVYYNLWITSNGGKTWILDKESQKLSDFFMNVFMLSNHDILAVGSDGYIFRSQKLNAVHDEELKICNEINLSLSPNPAKDFLEISYSPSIDRRVNPTVDGIAIFNVFGEKVLSTSPQPSPFLEREEPPRLTSSATPQEGNLLLDVSGLPPGVYFVKVGEKVGKFVKM